MFCVVPQRLAIAIIVASAAIPNMGNLAQAMNSKRLDKISDNVCHGAPGIGSSKAAFYFRLIEVA